MVGIIMGSLSDRKVMQEAAEALKELGVSFENGDRFGTPHT